MFRNLINFLVAIFKNRRLLVDLIKNDFKQKYVGNFLGVLWAFIQPATTIFVLWFVFQVGFKSQPVSNFPFVLWLITGLLPWFFFSEGLNTGTNSVSSNSFLVKKVVFRVSLLPIVPLVSALIVHAFFVVFMFCMFMYYGYSPSIYWLQIIYYIFASFVLLLGLSWITSSVVVFLRDIGQIVGVILQLGFWMTPIFWSLKMVPDKYHWLVKLNPVVYIIEGYRNTMIHHVWFWENMRMTVYFWLVTLVIFCLGAMIFRKLKPHFTDVL